ALQPVIDRENKHVDFVIVEGSEVSGDPGEATTSRGDTICLICRQVVKAAEARAAGVRGAIGTRLTVAVIEARGAGGKRYRLAGTNDLHAYLSAEVVLNAARAAHTGDLQLVPEEPIPYDPQNLKVR